VSFLVEIVINNATIDDGHNNNNNNLENMYRLLKRPN